MTSTERTQPGRSDDQKPVATPAPAATPTPTAVDTSPSAGSSADTMVAVVQDGYGSADVLRLATIPRPTAGAGEVLLQVRAAGINRSTWHLMTGKPHLLRLVFGIRRPRNPVLGQDVAGTVVALGPGVTRFTVGDEVFGMAAGSYATFAVAKQDKLAHQPAGLSAPQASVTGISALTALQALCDVGNVRAGQQVLITGASGGIGSFAVQLATALGADVTAVTSTGKSDLVRSWGAKQVIDRGREDFADGTRHYDLILDIAGLPRLSRLRRALAPTGTLVLVGGEQGGDWTGGTIGRQLRAKILSLFVKQRLTSVLGKERAADLERLIPFLAAGTVTPSVERTYPLSEVPVAMRQLEAGTVRGKVAIVL